MTRFKDPSPGYWQEYGQFQHVKHELIRRYLGGWFPKLGSWAGRVIYADTHAGRGRHVSGERGSPLVALRTLLDHGSTHLKKLMRGLRKQGVILADGYTGRFSFQANPRFRLP